MTSDWNTATLYSSFGAEGPVAGTDYDAASGVTVQPMEQNQQTWFDVTDSVAAWRAGTAANHGFVVRADGTSDNWQLSSSGEATNFTVGDGATFAILSGETPVTMRTPQLQLGAALVRQPAFPLPVRPRWIPNPPNFALEQPACGRSAAPFPGSTPPPAASSCRARLPTGPPHCRDGRRMRPVPAARPASATRRD
jgi:hypothetical protein